MYIPQFRALMIFLLNEKETYILTSYMLWISEIRLLNLTLLLYFRGIISLFIIL